MFRPLLDIYILAATGYCLAGWGLSLIRSLNPLGYLAASFCIATTIVVYLRRNYPSCQWRFPWHGWRFRRFRGWLPCSFLALAVLIFWGGIMHEPNNHDGLSYRIPRVLHWLNHGSWFWTGNFDERMDTRSTNFEWLSAPFLALMKSDRLMFLWNWFGFLLFPSLIFQLCRKFGAKGRVAWNWMWLAPSAYGVILQAGGIGNDFIGAVFFLASLNFVLSCDFLTRRETILSGLAISLCVGIKSSNLIWVIPWALLFLGNAVRCKLPALWIVPCLFLFLVCASFPNFIANHLNTGDWTGARAEEASGKPAIAKNPAVALCGNVLLLALQSFIPPLWPWIGATHDFVIRLLPPDLFEKLASNFEGGFRDLGIRELPQEEGAGLGFGLMILVVLSLAGTCLPTIDKQRPKRSLVLVLFGITMAFFVYATKLVMPCPSRILLPGLLFLPIWSSTFRGQKRLLQTSCWKACSCFAVASSLLVICVSPSRPMIPPAILLFLADTAGMPDPLRSRMKLVYDTYANRARVFDPLLSKIPISRLEEPLGYTGGSALEASLWKPYGSRLVIPVRLADYEVVFRKSLPSLVIASALSFPAGNYSSPLRWVKEQNGDILAEKELVFQARIGPENFFLLQFPLAAPTPDCR